MVCEINDICLIFQTKLNKYHLSKIFLEKKTVQIGAEKTSLSGIEAMILFIHDIGRFMHIFKQFEGIEGCNIKSVFKIILSYRLSCPDLSQNHTNHVIGKINK